MQLSFPHFLSNFLWHALAFALRCWLIIFLRTSRVLGIFWAVNFLNISVVILSSVHWWNRLALCSANCLACDSFNLQMLQWNLSVLLFILLNVYVSHTIGKIYNFIDFWSVWDVSRGEIGTYWLKANCILSITCGGCLIEHWVLNEVINFYWYSH